jgi:hypothetical protein
MGQLDSTRTAPPCTPPCRRMKTLARSVHPHPPPPPPPILLRLLRLLLRQTSLFLLYPSHLSAPEYPRPRPRPRRTKQQGRHFSRYFAVKTPTIDDSQSM